MQVQGFESVFWEGYLDTLRLLIRQQFEKLDDHIRQAIWFHMDIYEENAPMVEDEIVDFILHAHVLSAAVNWSNKHIRSCMQ